MTIEAEFEQQVHIVTSLLEAVADEQAAVAQATRRLAAETVRSAQLSARFRLSESECSVLWFLAAHAADAHVRSLLVGVAGDSHCSTEALRRCVYSGEGSLVSMQELASDSRLIERGLVQEQTTGEAYRRVWTIAPRLLAWLRGDDDLCREVAAFSRLSGQESMGVSLYDSALRTEVGKAASGRSLILVTGAPGLGKRTALLQAASVRVNEFETTLSRV